VTLLHELLCLSISVHVNRKMIRREAADDLGDRHGHPQDCFLGIGKLGVCGFFRPAGSINRAPLGCVAKPPEADKCFENNA